MDKNKAQKVKRKTKDEQVEELKEEVLYLKGEIMDLEIKLEAKETECDAATDNLAEMADHIQDLEAALAEAHLMPKDDDDPTYH